MGAIRRCLIYLRRNVFKNLILLSIIVLITSLIITTNTFVYASNNSVELLKKQLMKVFTLQQDAYNEEFNKDPYVYTGPKLTPEIYSKIQSINGIKDSNWERLAFYGFYEFEGRCDPFPGMYKTAAMTEDWRYTGEQLEGIVNCLMLSEQIGVYGNMNTRLNSYFTTGKVDLYDGRHITPSDSGVIMVSKDLAEINDISVGDVLRIGTSKLLFETGDLTSEELDEEMAWMREDPDTWDSREFYYSIPFQVVGIFEVELNVDMPENTPLYMLTEPTMIENTVFVDFASVDVLMDEYRACTGESDVLKDDWFDEMTFEVSDEKNLETVMEEIKETIPETRVMRWTTNDNTFIASAAPIKWVSKIMNIIGIFTILTGMIVLTLILLFWEKGREIEAGVLLSLGIKKSSILCQYVLEGTALVLFSIIIALPVSNLIIRQIDSTEVLSVAAVQVNQETMLEGEAIKPKHYLLRYGINGYRNYTPERLDVRSVPTIIVISMCLVLVTTITAVLLANLSCLTIKPRKLFQRKR